MSHAPAPNQPATPPAELRPAGFFVIRTPLLPFDEFLAWGAAADRRAFLRGWAARPEVRDALFVASPDLEGSLDHWLAAPESERGQKAERALVRYFARMSGRATPFGLFAGWGVGRTGEATRLAIAPRGAGRRHTRLDMDYLFALADALAHDPALRGTWRYLPNSSIYRAGGRLRYAEARVSGRLRTYHLVAVEPSDALEATLARASRGATAHALAAALAADDPEVTLDEAAEFVGELIDSQLLLPDIAPAVTGEEPIGRMVRQLRGSPATAALGAQLGAARDAIDAIDAAGLGADPERYREVAGLLEGLPARPEIARLFQVDLARPADDATLGPELAADLARGAELLRRLAPSGADALDAFRKAFTARYEAREVPLLEALDEEHGVGFGPPRATGPDAAPLLGGLAFPGAAEHAGSWPARQALLLRKVDEAARAGAQAIELSDADIEQLAAREPRPLASTVAIMASVAQPGDGGAYEILLHGLSGASAARLLGRFCHADDALHEQVRELLRAEEARDPGAVFAEIAHLPEGRVGNILCRPVLRDYEIAYLGSSGAPRERQIAADDLLVSVVGERVVLRSRRLGRRVEPRLSSAHNYAMRSMPLYKFLCALQGQGSTYGMSWDWGALEALPFLPRVAHGRLVLARARWLARKPELERLGAARGAERFAAAQAWRAERGLPRVVLLDDGDNELPVDFDNPLSVESLIDLVKGRPQATLTEMFPGPGALAASGPEGRFVHELVVPFVCGASGEVEKPRSGAIQPAAYAPPATQRSFAPGSEWLYAKLYTGMAAADGVLREVVAPLVRAAERSGAIDRWFFIRYNDPEHHLRVRFHGSPARLYGELLPALHAAAAPLLADGRIWRMQLDTYEREIERYGGAAGIELAERLFHADSQAVLAIVERNAGDAGIARRWRLALRGVDQLLADLGLAEAERHALIKQARDGYAHEVRADTRLHSQLGDAYRQQRKQLDGLLAATPDDEPALAPLLARSAQLAPIVAELRAHEAAGRLSLAGMALSLAHMHVNRLMRTAQRRQELVLYEFLDRLYEARLARARAAARASQ